ncbi:hypothetical protein [Streptomyces sp. ODS28]|uniref:hypothetical protein n=1 Tax=Streptomyces sp. ODS28 TaxID=3136688 RepID=UPI0031EB1EFF
MSQNSDGGPEYHHNNFYGPTSIGGHQHLAGGTPMPTPPRSSVLSRAWATIVAVWAASPTAAWWTQHTPAGPPKVEDLVHAATPFILLVGGVAVCLDTVGYVLYRRWAAAQRAITDPVTWTLRLVMILVGGAVLGVVMYAHSLLLL